MNEAIDRVRITAPEQLGGSYLTFLLSKEEYGIEVLAVREILAMVAVTPLPRSPGFVKGVVNVRGRIVPVLDLRMLFGMPAAFDALTCIVVVEVAVAGGAPRLVGCVVDTVGEVLSVGREQIEAVPRCTDVPLEYLTGLARLGERVVVLLDIGRAAGRLDAEQTGA